MTDDFLPEPPPDIEIRNISEFPDANTLMLLLQNQSSLQKNNMSNFYFIHFSMLG